MCLPPSNVGAKLGGVEARFAVKVAAEGSLVGEGQWEAVTNREFQNYFVDGTLLCCRWKMTDDSDELREWWEIESIEGGVMKWKALRQRENGSTYTATFWRLLFLSTLILSIVGLKIVG